MSDFVWSAVSIDGQDLEPVLPDILSPYIESA